MMATKCTKCDGPWPCECGFQPENPTPLEAEDLTPPTEGTTAKPPSKYAVGDWTRSDSDGSFCVIRRAVRLSFAGEPMEQCYDVAYMSREWKDWGLRNVGDESGVVESRLLPITDQKDILLCRASEVKAKQHEASKELEKLTADFDSLMRARELLKG